MNANEIFERINNALIKCNRNDKVFFTAVSKTRTIQEMKEAEKFSCIDFFGENRVQEGMEKRKNYGESRILWRLIGHLQANKVRKAVEIFDTIDSIDDLELAQRVNRICSETGKIMPILIEVNTSGESSKSGINPEKFSELAENIVSLNNLKLEGLMTVGPITDSESEIRRSFANLRELSDKAREFTGLELPILSMGMSDDFELAIQEGSTMVRIGTLLFGKREYK